MALFDKKDDGEDFDESKRTKQEIAEAPRAPIFERPTSKKLGIKEYRIYKIDGNGVKRWLGSSDDVSMDESYLFSTYGPGTYIVSAYGPRQRHVEDKQVEVAGDPEQWESQKRKQLGLDKGNGKVQEEGGIVQVLDRLIAMQTHQSKQIEGLFLKQAQDGRELLMNIVDEGKNRASEAVRLAETRIVEERQRREMDAERLKMEHQQRLEELNERWRQDEEARRAREDSRLREMEMRNEREIQLQREMFQFQQQMQREANRGDSELTTMLLQKQLSGDNSGRNAISDTMALIEQAKGLVDTNNKETSVIEMIIGGATEALGALARAPAPPGLTAKAVANVLRSNPDLIRQFVSSGGEDDDGGSDEDVIDVPASPPFEG